MSENLTPEFMSRIRILTEKDKKSLIERALKLSEETGELAQAVLIFRKAYGTGYRTGAKRLDVAEEVVDIFIVSMSILAHLMVTDREIDQLIDEKLNKWVKTMEVEEQ